MSQTHTLMTFNIPTHLKTNFDELSKFKRVSKTSIINHLIEWYCRNEKKNSKVMTNSITSSVT